ncbi:MAG: hypothetical protein ABIC40_07375, partial [bacterium]
YEVTRTKGAPKSAYINWAKKKAKTDPAYDNNSVYQKDFRAYWEVRNALLHGAGHCQSLKWPGSGRAREIKPEVVRKLGEWKINDKTELYGDTYEKAFGLERLWSGLVGFINQVAYEFEADHTT